MAKMPPEAMEGMDADMMAKMPPEAMEGMDADMMANMPLEAVEIIPQKVINKIIDEFSY